MGRQEISAQFDHPHFWRQRIEEAGGNYLDAIQGGVDWDKVKECQKELFEKFLHGKVLDAGCGIGRTIEIMPDDVTKFIGIDISPDFIEEAKRRYPEGDFRVMNAKKTTFKDNEFDWVVAAGMGGHPKDPHSDFFTELKGELIRIGRSVIFLWLSKPTEFNIYHNDFYKYEKIEEGE